MKINKKQIIEFIKKLKTSGFFSIYLSTILTKVIVMFGGIIIARIFSMEDYAKYTLINNAFAMLTILGDFGTSSALFIFLVEKSKNEGEYSKYLRFGIIYGIITSIISCLFILISPVFYPYKNNIILLYTLFLCMIPLLNVLTGIVNIILRSKEENNKYSLYQVLSIIIHYTIAIVLIMVLGLKGSIICQYIYGILILVLGIYILFHYKIINIKKLRCKLPTKEEIRQFISLAMSSQLANLTSSLLYSIDIFVIGLMINSERELAIYKVSTVIPTALSFLPSCLMIYLLPYFVKNNKDEKWILENSKKLVKYSLPIYFIIFLLGIFTSKYIFSILYGDRYLESAYPFSILMVGFLFNATINVPIGNVICALKRPKYNTYINIISLFFNVILNYIFINKIGYIGAAITTTIVIIVSSIFSWIFMKKILNENRRKNEKNNYSNK